MDFDLGQMAEANKL